jgi:Protein of unknown function (DUF3096)
MLARAHWTQPTEVPIAGDSLTLAQKGTDVNIDLTLNGVVALLAGILILIFPSLLARVVAAYLILIGLIQVFDLRF